MKKQVLAAAVVGAFAAPAAYAQTTLYGIVDIGYQNASGYGNRNKSFIEEGMHSPSRLGVRGSEDLAGGMYAMYGLEFNAPVDDGGTSGTAVNFNRLAYGGIGSKAWGELTLGRQYTHTFHTFAVGSAHAYGTFASAYGWTGIATRASNSIKYSSPVFSGLSVGAIWSPSGQRTQEPARAGSTATVTATEIARFWDAAVRYTPGPFGAAASIGRNKDETPTVTAGTVEAKFWSLAGNWDNKAFGVYAQLFSNKVSSGATGGVSDRRQWSISPVARFGSHELYGLYGKNKQKEGGSGTGTAEAKIWGIVFEEVMSKRTRLYAGYGRANNTGGVGPLGAGGLTGLGPTNFAGAPNAGAGQLGIGGAPGATLAGQIPNDKSVRGIQLGVVHTF